MPAGRVARGPVGVDPFQVLGLTSAATLEEVRLAFRQRALARHPDQGGSAEEFIAVKHAYDAIVKRRRRSR